VTRRGVWLYAGFCALLAAANVAAGTWLNILVAIAVLLVGARELWLWGSR